MMRVMFHVEYISQLRNGKFSLIINAVLEGRVIEPLDLLRRENLWLEDNQNVAAIDVDAYSNQGFLNFQNRPNELRLNVHNVLFL